MTSESDEEPGTPCGRHAATKWVTRGYTDKHGSRIIVQRKGTLRYTARFFSIEMPAWFGTKEVRL
jgi:hypothetical protein